MTIQAIKPGTTEMLRGLARFSELTRCNTGLPDMGLPEGRRTFLNVLGFEQPEGEGAYSPESVRRMEAAGTLRPQ